MTPWFITLPWLHYLDFTYNEVYHEARFEKDKRYYVLRLEKDLLDDWTITAINGRIKSKLGQRRILDFFNVHKCVCSILNHDKNPLSA
ncbi:hypothetical protein SDB66_13185 [Legionella pneumophila serogroup 6]